MKKTICLFGILSLLILVFTTCTTAQQSFHEFPKLDTSKSNIDVSLIMRGGPPRDGIPALTNPDFITVEQADLPLDMRGMFVDFGGDQRFYPYSILVWHEIVNDVVGGKHIAVTFCPLCGSALLFDREVDGEILEFGVSGFLYQSNMLMYDRTTESFWSQAMRESVLGAFTGTALDILPFQLLEFGEASQKYPDMKVQSPDTGYNRDYSRYPYGDYEDNMALFFPVIKEDDRYHPKKLMYIFDADDITVALDPDILNDNSIERKIDDRMYTITQNGGEVLVVTGDETIPGYWEMWFSWFIHHSETGMVLSE